MANIFQNVQTFQKASLGLLLNRMVFVSTINTKFKEFNTDFAGNLGDTITFDTPPNAYAHDSLVVDSFDSVKVNVETLTVDQEANTNFAVTNQERIFNMDPMEYMEVFGKSYMATLANKVEGNVASAILDSTYRFYGDGVTAINSMGQLANANAMFRNTGVPSSNLKVYLDDIAQASIVNTALTQFVPKRNEEMANSWDIGSFNMADYYVSNLLPTHVAGTLGEDATVLTVVSTNDPNGANITQITFSGAGTDSSAVKANDLGQFSDGVSGQPNLRFLTEFGQHVSQNKVQVRATIDSASSAGNVTVTISPALVAVPGKTQNINTNIVAGMQFKFVPSHRRGLILANDAFYLGMPRLPDQSPYIVATKYDDDSRVGMRMSYGSIFGKNQMGIIYDAIWGKRLVQRYAMAMLYPL